MKKAIIAGLVGFSVLFVACGPKADDAAKAKEDSIRKADSVRNAFVQDSTAKAAAAAPVDTNKVDTAKTAAPAAEPAKK